MPQFWGVDVGQPVETVTTNSSTTSKDVEVVVNTNADVESVQEAINSLETIKLAMLKLGKNWS